MRKYGFIVVIALFCLLSAGCRDSRSNAGKTGQSDMQETSEQQGKSEGSQTSEGKAADPSQERGVNSSSDPQNSVNQHSDSSKEKVSGSVRVLGMGNQNMHCLSDTGYYYITEDSSELKKDFYGRQIMYMDFATKQEVFLCNEPGCKHNDKNCSAVLTEDEIESIGSALLFVWKDKLYMVSKYPDNEGTVEVNELWADGEDVSVNRRMPTTIYSMGLDGTNRKKEYTFAQDVTIEDMVLCDDEALYFTAKQINTSSEKGTTYSTASKRELVRYQPDGMKLETVCSLEFGDQIRWHTIGCYDGKVIVQGTKYNKKLSFQEEMELGQEEYWEYANDSSEIFAALNLADGSLKNIYSLKNDSDSINSTVMLDDYLYISAEKEGKINKVNLGTGKVEGLVKLKQGYIAGILSDKLCCQSWNQGEDHDNSWYFVDCNTGKVEHSTLVNKRNGWALEIIGEIGSQVLVIYDYEGKEEEKDTWDISRYQYGLIEKKDLCQGVDRFQKIAMKGAGK